MLRFLILDSTIQPAELSRLLVNNTAGALVTFEGWVRNHSQGKPVLSLEYEVYEILAQKEGEKILREAHAKFGLCGAVACHRQGHLAIGDIAVWVGATAEHRGAAFAGARYIIDAIKERLPIWKKEYYWGEPPRWVLCQKAKPLFQQFHKNAIARQPCGDTP